MFTSLLIKLELDRVWIERAGAGFPVAAVDGFEDPFYPFVNEASSGSCFDSKIDHVRNGSSGPSDGRLLLGFIVSIRVTEDDGHAAMIRYY